MNRTKKITDVVNGTPLHAHRTPHYLPLLAALLALGAGTTRLDAANAVTPPPVPENLEVAAGNVPYLMLHAVGTQNQVCAPRPSGVGFGWTLYGPQATLFDEEGGQQLTHFLSPNPDEDGAGRATWLHSKDSSSVWAAMSQTSSDPAYVEAGAVPWLKLRVVGRVDGPTGGDRLTATTFIQRVNTVGGTAPATDCAPLGAKLLVPYEADYVFYREK